MTFSHRPKLFQLQHCSLIFDKHNPTNCVRKNKFSYKSLSKIINTELSQKQLLSSKRKRKKKSCTLMVCTLKKTYNCRSLKMWSTFNWRKISTHKWYSHLTSRNLLRCWIILSHQIINFYFQSSLQPTGLRLTNFLFTKWNLFDFCHLRHQFSIYKMLFWRKKKTKKVTK